MALKGRQWLPHSGFGDRWSGAAELRSAGVPWADWTQVSLKSHHPTPSCAPTAVRQSMAVCPFSDQTLFSALALRKLGREEVGGRGGAEHRARGLGWPVGRYALLCVGVLPFCVLGGRTLFGSPPLLLVHHDRCPDPSPASPAWHAQEAHRLLERLLGHAQVLAASEAAVDYFATSLPTMLLFHDDIQERQVGRVEAIGVAAWECDPGARRQLSAHPAAPPPGLL